ncbi:MAG: M15 family metallopeptidase [Bdellovibrionota bacterium]
MAFALCLMAALPGVTQAQVGGPADPEKACAYINARYSTCGKRFDYDGKSFFFTIGSTTKRLDCTDGRKLEYYDRIDQMDMASVFFVPYIAGPMKLPEVRRNYDPGRLRSEELMKAVYGIDEAHVWDNLVKVRFLNQTLRMNKKLGAAAALARAGVELEALAKTDPAVAKFLLPFTRTEKPLQVYGWVWRVVAGTERLSTHSFGTAIDILTNVGPQYWLNDERVANPAKAKQGEQAYRNDHYIPKGAPIFNQKVVDVMEKNGYIWGAKWNHYDTMHFEYRPEFLPKSVIDCR